MQQHWDNSTSAFSTTPYLLSADRVRTERDTSVERHVKSWVLCWRTCSDLQTQDSTVAGPGPSPFSSWKEHYQDAFLTCFSLAVKESERKWLWDRFVLTVCCVGRSVGQSVFLCLHAHAHHLFCMYNAFTPSGIRGDLLKTVLCTHTHTHTLQVCLDQVKSTRGRGGHGPHGPPPAPSAGAHRPSPGVTPGFARTLAAAARNPRTPTRAQVCSAGGRRGRVRGKGKKVGWVLDFGGGKTAASADVLWQSVVAGLSGMCVC
jgi:hypothetical protein